MCSSVDTNIQQTLQTFRSISEEREQLLEELAQACGTEEHMGMVGATAIRVRRDHPFRHVPKQELLDKITFYKNSAVYEYIRHPDERIGPKTDFEIDQTDAFTITPVGVPYVSELLSTTKHLILKSATGTGKTQLLIQLLEQHPDARILSISSRISLVHDQFGRFKDLGFQSYLDLKEVVSMENNNRIKANRLCVSFDSLYLVQDVHLYDSVVLDECDSTVKHMFAESVKNRKACVSALMNVLANAKRIIAMDADITDLSLCLLRKYCEKVETRFIINTVQPATGKQVIVFPCKYSLLDDLIKMVKAGKRMFICSDTAELVVTIKRVLQQKCELAKFKIYIRDIGDRTELQNIGLYWVKVQYVLCSPCITYGVNDDVSKFEYIYAFYKNCTINIQEQMQQISRPRDATVVKLWSQGRKECNYCTDYSKIEIHSKLHRTLPIRIDNPRDGLLWVLRDSKGSLFTQLYCYYLRNLNISRNNPKDGLIDLLSLKGYQIEEVDLSEKKYEGLKKKMKREKLETLVDQQMLWNDMYYIDIVACYIDHALLSKKN